MFKPVCSKPVTNVYLNAIHGAMNQLTYPKPLPPPPHVVRQCLTTSDQYNDHGQAMPDQPWINQPGNA